MKLETLQPAPHWDETAYRETVDILRSVRDDVSVHVWGGDWCKDCKAILPEFGAALDAAGYDLEQVFQYPVEKEADGTKVGPKVDEYDIKYIPTVVVERDGVVIARFVESADVPAAVALAHDLVDRQESV